MTNTREHLDTLTAKALRPIAADLGITGASRMRKDDLISAIIAAEDTEAAKSEGDIPAFDEEAVYAQADTAVSPAVVQRAIERELARLAADVEEAHGLALVINDKLTQVARLEAHPSREARSAAYDVREEILAAGFAAQAIANVPRQQAPKADNSEVRAALTPPPVEAPQYFARQTRRGTETVVLEREHGGRVDYRIIDPRTGRRSPCAYSLKAHRFSSRYVAVPK